MFIITYFLSKRNNTTTPPIKNMGEIPDKELVTDFMLGLEDIEDNALVREFMLGLETEGFTVLEDVCEF